MSKSKGHDRRHLVDMTVHPTPDPSDKWAPPPEEECEEYIYDFAVGDQGEICRVRIMCDSRDRIVEFALMQMTRIGGKSEQVARVDTAHGKVHIHQLVRNGTERIRDLHDIKTQEDVERGYNEGIDFITAHWEENRRRWNHGC